MADNLDTQTLIKFVIGDFETAWNAVASIPAPNIPYDPPVYRGNFMFARQATLLLELACRVCQSDPTGSLMATFSSEIQCRDPRYFWELPGPVWLPGQRTKQEFSFPSISGHDPYSHILAAIFNLIRNGQAHQNQQMHAVLNDGSNFCVSLTGARENLLLHTVPVIEETRPSDHLSYKEEDNDIWLTVRTDVFFLDIRDAVRSAQLDARGRTLNYLVEDRGKKTFNFDKQTLKGSLAKMANSPSWLR